MEGKESAKLRGADKESRYTTGDPYGNSGLAWLLQLQSIRKPNDPSLHRRLDRICHRAAFYLAIGSSRAALQARAHATLLF